MGKEVVLRAENLCKEFHKQAVLDGITLAIEKGEIFGLIGASGSGKTTLLHTFIGFHEPEEGDVFFTHDQKEFSLHTHLSFVRKTCGFAPQHPSFYHALTVEENLLHFGILYGLDEEEMEQQAEMLLAMTKLQNVRDLPADQLSYGMQKRLGIACALVHRPSLLFLDEPTADLDPLMRKDIWNMVKRINEQGTTIIVASHLLGEVEAMCSRIGMLHNGKLVYTGTFDDMKAKYSPRQEITVKTASHLYDDIIVRIKKCKEVSSFSAGSQLQVTTANPEATVQAIVFHVKELGDKIEYLHVSPPSLDEIFSLIEEEK